MLTLEEEKAIRALKRVAKIWPDSLWLFSANGILCVMKKENGEQVMDGHSVDQKFVITTVDIENDGGDF